MTAIKTTPSPNIDTERGYQPGFYAHSEGVRDEDRWLPNFNCILRKPRQSEAQQSERRA